MTDKNEAADNLKILVCGMPFSATAWALDVLHAMLPSAQVRSLHEIEPGSPQERAFCEAQGLVLGKCYHYSRALSEAADIVVYSYRDLRTAAVSALRKFGHPCTGDQLAAWVSAMEAWMPRADVVLRYESVLAETPSAVAMLADVLSKNGVQPRHTADSMVRPNLVDEPFAARRFADQTSSDAKVANLPEHVAGRVSEILGEEDRLLFAFVESRFFEWLRAHAYLDADVVGAYGQEAEYQIALAVLQHMAGGLAVDVGVEKGSFIELALRAGAGTVVGFEPLPRHQAFLHQRFQHVPAVTIHPLAVSDRSARAQLHVAVDREGNELDYHHTLSDLGDSATVVRSTRAIDVQTVALKDLVRDGLLPAQIDFLKIDTDGHDLSVLQGLGDVRPRVVMAEYWDTLPDTSGHSPYTLSDLVDWAAARGYPRFLVVRRHGFAELVEWDVRWTIAGDWGNVFFFREDLDLTPVMSIVDRVGAKSYRRMSVGIQELVQSVERKEEVIQALAAANAEHQRLENASQGAIAPSSSVDAAADVTHLGPASTMVHADVQALHAQLRAKEEVIQEQQRALSSYRLFAPVLRPVLPTIRAGRGLLRLLQPKIGRLHHHPPIPLVWPTARALSEGARAPTISLVTPSFRQAHFLGRTVDSVLNQGYPKLEYFVQDGGSDDGSVEVLRSYDAQLTGWTSAPDGGQSQAINAGFKRTSGEIMAWLNSDDLLLPGTLATVADYFATHPQVDVVYGNRILIDEEDREIGRWVLPPHSDTVLSWADFVPQETLFWRRALWEKVGGVDESFRFAMDWDLLLRFRDAGARMVRLPHFLGAFRIHEAQKTSAVINEIGMQEMARLRRRTLGRDVSYAEIRRALVPYLLRHVQSDLAYRVRRRLRAGV